jgi:hypothetical protein
VRTPGTETTTPTKTAPHHHTMSSLTPAALRPATPSSAETPHRPDKTLAEGGVRGGSEGLPTAEGER